MNKRCNISRRVFNFSLDKRSTHASLRTIVIIKIASQTKIIKLRLPNLRTLQIVNHVLDSNFLNAHLNSNGYYLKIIEKLKLLI